MKKLIFLALLCFQFSNAQAYLPLLDQTNQWHFTSCNFGCLTDVYYTDGDTIVNGLNHKILDGYHYISRSFLLRENTSAKKVYLTKVNANSNPEYLLYDFSLNEGDTFNIINPLSPFPQNGGPFILDSIRMKPLLNNIDFKHFYFSPTSTNTISTTNVVWIEGVGGKSLINAPGGNAAINEAGHLSCFFKNSVLVYSQLDSISECSYQTLENNNFVFSTSQVIRSEQKNRFYITNSNKIEKIEIYNIKGQRLNLLSFNKNLLIELSLENTSSGLYFILAFDDLNRYKRFKIIVE
ncbi:T9SS type A sorting domain-containing protein [uncultured Flavobacterium sp.]|uniref:T9SS type A sorting domain-containing protein n=1 Tax=uncultured Flavobacterium sp. TaxID=165435 RepID=UPI0030CA5B79